MADELITGPPGGMFVPAVQLKWTDGPGHSGGHGRPNKHQAERIAISLDLPNRLTGRIFKGETDALFTWIVSASERELRRGQTWTEAEAELEVQRVIDENAGRFYAARNAGNTASPQDIDS
jgi:hypothetical protein